MLGLRDQWAAIAGVSLADDELLPDDEAALQEPGARSAA
jgi:hypothetical protein